MSHEIWFEENDFTATQGLLIREQMVAFFGNELSIGLILGIWT